MLAIRIKLCPCNQTINFQLIINLTNPNKLREALVNWKPRRAI